MNYFIDCLTKKYACFSGRARRQEYWMFVLFNIIACIIVSVVSGVLVSVTNVTAFAFLGTIYNLAVLIPGFAVLVRRLHDTGRSGWWCLIMLIALIPFICWGAAGAIHFIDIEQSCCFRLTQFISFIYNIICGIVLLVFCCLDSQPGENQYGPNPKGL